MFEMIFLNFDSFHHDHTIFLQLYKLLCVIICDDPNAFIIFGGCWKKGGGGP